MQETHMIMDVVENTNFVRTEEEFFNATNSSGVDTSETTLQNILDSSPSRMFHYQKTQPKTRKYQKIGRNDLCPCGSGKKYKNCCLSSGEYEGFE